MNIKIRAISFSQVVAVLPAGIRESFGAGDSSCFMLDLKNPC